jgi:putative nucleotidyltransferase with HDIG domain
MILPLASLAAVYFLLNTGLTAVAVAMSKSVPIVQLWRRHFAVISVNYFAAASAAFFLVVVVRYLGIVGVAAVIPLVLVCYLALSSWFGRVDDAQRHVVRINELYVSTVSALSAAIEAKDGVTSDHIHRVQAYAIGLARAIGVTDPQAIQAIEAAALLHDTGKLAIPEHILNKPGRLTPAEFETMKSHVSVGADILSAIDFPYPVVPIVRAHHENWDGTGYPNGLRGEDIPIGARILSVVDCFDALRSDRPYRPAMTEEAALDILVQRRGTMYDPVVVDTFLRVYRDIRVPDPQPQLQALMRNIRQGSSRSQPEGAPRHADSGAHQTQSASDEVLGFVSLARLAAGSPTIRDVGALAASQLLQIAPGATFVLFAVDDQKSAVISHHAAGPAASRLAPMTIRLGESITGWVAANARSMINSDAALDLGPGVEDVLRFSASVPLIADTEAVGVLTLYGHEPFAHELALTLEMIAPHLAAALTCATRTLLVPAVSAEGRTTGRNGLSIVQRPAHCDRDSRSAVA